nr:lipopolysaccharide biosynthesis protein [Aeromicrobium chenweiae]
MNDAGGAKPSTPAGPGSGPLARSAARGAAITMGGRFTRIFLQFVGVAALARVLSPSDFGLVAMVMAFTGLGEILRDFGLSNAAIQAKTLSAQHRDNLFWMSTALGTIIAVLVVMAAPAISHLYDDSRLLLVTQILASTFVINGMTAQYRANLARELRFLSLQLTDLIPAVIGLASAVGLALAGAGYWALVAQQLTQTAAGLLMAAVFARWLPGRPRRLGEMSSYLRFGGNYLLAQILSFGTKNVHSVVLGLRFSPAAVGLYSRAYDLVVNSTNQIVMPASKVSVAVLARLQNDERRYVDFLLAGQKVLLHLVLPLLGIGAALAYPLVDIVLGPAWTGSAPVVQLLAASAAINAAAYVFQWYSLSKGYTGLDLKVNLVVAPIWIALVVGGSVFGLKGVASGFLIGQCAHWTTTLVWFHRSAGAPSVKMFLAAARALLPNVAAAAVAYIVAGRVFDLSSWQSVGLGTLVYVIAWSICIGAYTPLRRDVSDALSIGAYLRPDRTPPPSRGGVD